MYKKFFGLNKTPFRITPDTQLFFEGCDRGDSLLALCYAVCHEEGITKVIGEVGTGKTMLCRMLPLKAGDNIDWVYLPHPNLSPLEVLSSIAHELGLALSEVADTLSLSTKIQHELIRRHAQGRRVVVLIDEAQAMSLESLEEVRLLSNLETDEHKLLQIVLFGQPELETKLSLPQIRQLRERITNSFDLEEFSLSDLQEYLNFRMRSSGYCGPDLFSAQVTKKIHKHSRGLVRRINIIADKVLLSAFIANRHTITVADVKHAVQEGKFETRPFWKFPKLWGGRSRALSAHLILIIALMAQITVTITEVGSRV